MWTDFSLLFPSSSRGQVGQNPQRGTHTWVLFTPLTQHPHHPPNIIITHTTTAHSNRQRRLRAIYTPPPASTIAWAVEGISRGTCVLLPVRRFARPFYERRQQGRGENGGNGLRVLKACLPSLVLIRIIIVLFSPRVGDTRTRTRTSHTPGLSPPSKATLSRRGCVAAPPRPPTSCLCHALPAVLPHNMHHIGLRFACKCLLFCYC